MEHDKAPSFEAGVNSLVIGRSFGFVNVTTQVPPEVELLITVEMYTVPFACSSRVIVELVALLTGISLVVWVEACSVLVVVEELDFSGTLLFFGDVFMVLTKELFLSVVIDVCDTKGNQLCHFASAKYSTIVSTTPPTMRVMIRVLLSRLVFVVYFRID